MTFGNLSFGSLSLGFGLGGGGSSLVNAPIPELNINSASYSASNAYDSLIIPYSSTTGNVMVRITGRNNGATGPVLNCTWNDAAMTAAPVASGTGDGEPLAAFFAISGGTIGSGNIVLSCAAGSAGRGVVRVSSLIVLSDPPFGKTASSHESGMLAEITMNGMASSSNVATVICADPACYPFSSNEFSTQNQLAGADIASYFGQTASIDLNTYGAFFAGTTISDFAMVTAELRGVR